MKQNGVVCLPGPALLFFIFRFEYLVSGEGPLSYRDFRETSPLGSRTAIFFSRHNDTGSRGVLTIEKILFS